MNGLFMSNVFKVIHLPTTVGGNPQGISKHLNGLGVKSETWTLSQNYFGYPADKVLCKENEGLFVRELKRILALRYIFRADVVFFNFGSSFFRPFIAINDKKYLGYKKVFAKVYPFYSRMMSIVELGLISLLKKPIFIQYQGDDARQGDYCRKHFEITTAYRVEKGYYTAASDEAKRKSIALYAKRARKIYALNPDLLHVLPRTAEFLPYSHISLDEWAPVYTQLQKRPLRIGHAPSHRAFKGTDLLLEATEQLRFAGFEFELILVEGKSNAEAKEIYKTVDVLVDQLFAGWYGGLAVEAMALGKPVVAYIRQEDLHFIPEQMRSDLPIIQAKPSTVGVVLESILKMPRAELLEKAHNSRLYVEKWHHPMAIAKKIKKDMEIALNKRD